MKMENCTFKLGSNVYTEGDPVEYLYFIKSGKIELSILENIEKAVKEDR